MPIDTLPPLTDLPSLQGSHQPVEPVINEETGQTVTIPVSAAPAKPITNSLTVKFNSTVSIISVIATFLVATQPEFEQAITNAVPNTEVAVALIGVLGSVIGLANILIRVYHTRSPIQR